VGGGDDIQGKTEEQGKEGRRGEPAINGTCDGKQNEHKRWQPKGWRNEIYSFFEAVLKLLKSEVQCTKWYKYLRGDYSERMGRSSAEGTSSLQTKKNTRETGTQLGRVWGPKWGAVTTCKKRQRRKEWRGGKEAG
jgi:hypothetical protein